MSWDDADFYSDDPLIRYNAHQASRGRPQMPDPDEVRKLQKEQGIRKCACSKCTIQVRPNDFTYPYCSMCYANIDNRCD